MGCYTVSYTDKKGKEHRISGFKDKEQAKKFEEVFSQASQFVESEYKKRKQAGDKKLALRYYLLLNYFKAKNPFSKE